MPLSARLGALCLLAALLLAACVPAPAPAERPLKHVTFMAGYKPQANLPFVAVYVAQKKGYFRDQGLEVDVQHSAGGGEHLKLTAAGQVQFATAQATDVLKLDADPGLPLVAFALFGQQGDQAFVVRRESGIASPKDWEGKTVGYKVFPSPDYLAILKQAGVDRAKVREVSVGFDPRVLADKQVDVLPVFKSNEPDLLERTLGTPIDLIDPADYGVPTLGLTYVTSRDEMQKDPDAVRAFLRATLKGVQDAQANPDEAIAITLEFAPKEGPRHQRFMLDTELALAQSDLTRANGLGWQTPEQWQRLDAMLVELGAVKRPLEPSQVMSDRFLREVYANGTLKWPS